MKDEKNIQDKKPLKSLKKAADKTRPTRKNATKKYAEIKVLNDDGSVKRTINIPNNGITYGQYKELSKKDPSSLNAVEKKQLADAQEQLGKMAKSLVSQYDVSAITKLAKAYAISPIAQQSFAKALAIDTSPMLKIATELRKSSLAMQPALSQALGIQPTVIHAIQALYKSSIFTQDQFTALAAIQKSLITLPTENILTTIKGIQDAFQAPLITRTLLADTQTKHERILRNLRFDVGSLTSSIEFSRFEKVDFDLVDVTSDKDSVIASATATQTSNAGNITFFDNASVVLAFNELKQDVQDLREQLLARDNKQGQQLISPSTVHFKRSTTTIQIGNFRVSAALSSKQTQFARTVIGPQESVGKRWDIDDVIFEVFGERINNNELNWIKKIRSYIWQFNQKVMIASGSTMPDYLVLNGIEVYVNPDYL